MDNGLWLEPLGSQAIERDKYQAIEIADGHPFPATTLDIELVTKDKDNEGQGFRMAMPPATQKSPGSGRDGPYLRLRRLPSRMLRSSRVFSVLN
jgi:hypothetical protein